MQRLLPYLLLFILSCVLFLPGMFTLPMVDRDSAHYAQASRQMLQTDNYFQVRFMNKPRYQKPPGIYWLQALAVKTFSHINTTLAWPFRLPSLLGGLLAVLLTFGFARGIVGTKTALLGASLLACSLLVVVESHMAITDAMLLATMVLMQGSLWKIYCDYKNNQSAHWRYPYLFWLGMAAGVLIKGITPLIGLLTIVGISIADRNIRWIKSIKPLTGILILLICSSWLIIVSFSSNTNFLWQMIHTDVAPKLVGGQQDHGAPPGYFLAIFLVAFWPASLFIWRTAVSAWQQRQQATIRFLLAWIIPNWIFFELVPTKLPQYVLPTYPAIAILTAIMLMNIDKLNLSKLNQRISTVQIILWAIVSLAIAAIVSYFPYFISGKISILAITTTLMLLIGSGICLYLVKQQRVIGGAIVGILTAVLAYGPLMQWILPSQTNLWISDKVAKATQQYLPHQINQHNPVLASGFHEPSLVFMLGTHNVVMTNPLPAANMLADGRSSVLLINKKQLNQFQSIIKRTHIVMKPITTIHGFNYSNGKWTTLVLMQRYKR